MPQITPSLQTPDRPSLRQSLLFAFLAILLASLACDLLWSGSYDPTPTLGEDVQTMQAEYTPYATLDTIGTQRAEYPATKEMLPSEPATQVPVWTQAPGPLPSVSPSENPSPQEVNEGTHTYDVTGTAISCEVNVGEPRQTRAVFFYDIGVDIAQSQDGVWKPYTRISKNQYVAKNEAGFTVAYIFSTDGFTMEFMKPGEDAPCSYFTFTIVDD